MQTSISLLLATVAACTVYSALSLPISKRETTLVYTILSKSSGRYMKMLDNGLVEATGQFVGSFIEPSAQWFLRMTSDGAFQLENFMHRDHYLVLAKHGDRTTLLTTFLGSSQDIVMVHRDRLLLASTSTEAESTAVTQQSTAETVESTVATTEPGSASGFGEDTVVTPTEMAPTEMAPTDSTPTDTTAVSTPTEVTATESTEDTYVAVEHNWLLIEHAHSLLLSFKIKPAEGQKEDCFLAFDRDGLPESNLCAITEDSATIELTFGPVRPF